MDRYNKLRKGQLLGNKAEVSELEELKRKFFESGGAVNELPPCEGVSARQKKATGSLNTK